MPSSASHRTLKGRGTLRVKGKLGFWSAFFSLVVLAVALAVFKQGSGVGVAKPAARVELSDKRTEFSKTFRNADGSYTTEIGLDQAAYKDTSGRVEPADTSLAADSDGYKAEANALKADFSGAGLVISRSDDTRGKLTYCPLDAEKAVAFTKKNDRTAKMAGYKQGADLEYEVLPGRIKESIILAQEPKDATFAFRLALDDLEPVRRKDGSIALVDAKGRERIIIEAAYMTDANSADLQLLPETYTSFDVTMTIDSEGQGIYTLKLFCDESWLADPDRQWPVVVDPTFSLPTTASADTYLREDTPAGTYHSVTLMNCGALGYSGKRIRDLVRFDISSIPQAAQITTATLSMPDSPGSNINIDDWRHQTTTNLLRVTTNWDTSACWNNMASNYASPAIATSTVSNPVYNVTSLVTQWHNGTYGNYGFMLSNAGEVKLLDDAVPTSGTPTPNPWTWNTSTVHSGTKSHPEMNASGLHEHYYINGQQYFIPTSSEACTWVYRSSTLLSSEIMLSYRVGSSETTSWYWGSDSINRTPRTNMGAQPSTGSWQKLLFTTDQVGIGGQYINGAKFTLYNGQVVFDDVSTWRRQQFYQREATVGADQKPNLSVTYWLPEIGLEGYKRYQDFGATKVDLSNGNLLYASQDVAIPGRGIPTAISHVYNSQGTTASAFGHGWSLDPLMKLVEDPNGDVAVTEGDGSRHIWTKSGSSYLHPPGIYRELTKDASASTYYLEDIHAHVTWIFNSSGQMTAATDANGNTTTYLYTSGNLTGIRDAAGRETTLTYASGKLSKIDWTLGLSKTDISQTDQAAEYVSLNGNSARQSFTVSKQMIGDKVDLYLQDASGQDNQLRVRIMASDGRTCLSDTYTTTPQGIYSAQPVTINIGDVELAPGSYWLQVYGYDTKVYSDDYDPYNGGLLQIEGVYSQGEWTSYPYRDLYFVLRHGEHKATFGYDGSGNLTSIVNGNEETTTFNYDSAHHMTRITAPEGGATDITATATGQTTSVKLPTTSTATWTFGYSNTLYTDSAETTVTDPRGYKTKYTFNTTGLCTKITDPLGATPDPSTTETDFPNDEAVEASAIAAYDSYFTTMVAQGKMTANEQATSTRTPSVDGTTTLFEYDSNRNVTKQTDKDGLYEAWTYDNNGNMLTERDRSGLENTYTYTANNDEDTETSPLGAVTDYDYDADGNLISETDAEGNETTYEYDQYGNHVGQVSARGNAPGADPHSFDTTFTVDANGYATKTERPVVHNADGTNVQAVTETSRSVTGQVLAQTDAYGNRTYLAYDGMGRQILANSPTNVEGSATVTRVLAKTTYDGDDAAVCNETFDEMNTWDPGIARISLTERDCDAGGQLLSETQYADASWPYPSDASTRSQSYDAMGNTATETNPLGGVTTYEYDALNRKTKEMRPDGSFDALKYNAVGNVVKAGNADGTSVNTYGVDHHNVAHTDKLGFTAKLVVDSSGARRRTAGPTGVSTETSYDAIGNVRFVDEPTGARTSHQWDAESNEIGVTFNDQNPTLETTTGVSLNEAGRIATQTDQQAKITAATYDPSMNLKKLLQPNGANQQVDYTAAGAVDSVQASGTIANSANLTLERDALGNVTHELSTDASSGALETSFTSTIDNDGRLTGRTDVSGVTLSLAHNDNRNITDVTDSISGSNGKIHYEYDTSARVTAVSCEGTSVAIAYDEDERSSETSALGGKLKTTMSYDVAGRLTSYVNRFAETTLSAYSYTYDGRGDITAAIEGTASLSFGYDSLRRLASATRPGSSVTYTYDNLGNRLAKVDSSAQTTVTYGYNDASELTSEIRSNESLTYLCDANGNLTSAISNVASTTTYAYDNNNQLVKVTKPNGTVVEFFYDSAGKCVEKRVNGSSTFYQYDSRDDLVLETNAIKNILVKYMRDKHGRALAMKQSGSTYYFLYNGHGDVTGVVNSSGNVIATYSYDEFGNLLASTGSVYSPMRYAAAYNAYYDGDIGLYRMGERYYSQITGRWLTRDAEDPVAGDPPAYQEYVYVQNNPLVGVDPAGRKVERLDPDIHKRGQLFPGWCWAACVRMSLCHFRGKFSLESPRQQQIVNWGKDQGYAYEDGSLNWWGGVEYALEHWGVACWDTDRYLRWWEVREQIDTWRSPIVTGYTSGGKKGNGRHATLTKGYRYIPGKLAQVLVNDPAPTYVSKIVGDVYYFVPGGGWDEESVSGSDIHVKYWDNRFDYGDTEWDWWRTTCCMVFTK